MPKSRGWLGAGETGLPFQLVHSSSSCKQDVLRSDKCIHRMRPRPKQPREPGGLLVGFDLANTIAVLRRVLQRCQRGKVRKRGERSYTLLKQITSEATGRWSGGEVLVQEQQRKVHDMNCRWVWRGHPTRLLATMCGGGGTLRYR